jgi:hypothetical protein
MPSQLPSGEPVFGMQPPASPGIHRARYRQVFMIKAFIMLRVGMDDILSVADGSSSFSDVIKYSGAIEREA